MTISVRYYDGITAAAHVASLKYSRTGYVLLVAEGFQREYALNKLKIHPPLGHVHPTIDLPDDGYLELLQRELPIWLGQSAKQHQFWAQLWQWENKLRYVALSFVFVLVGIFALMTYGVPAIAKYVAMSLPASTERVLSQQTLELLDKSLFSPSHISQAEQDELRLAFKQTISARPDIQLQFRDSSIGANALALPGGTIVITDDLMALAKNQQELLAVLAHEVGHVEQRHSLRTALSAASTGLVIAAITGDMDSVIAIVPATMAQLHYSRGFEYEADDYARQLMLRKGIPLHYFADILLRLSSVAEQKSSNPKDKKDNYWSTHPDTQQRIKPFLEFSSS